ncbi:hypothetical protein J437_LFUL003748 [Ladona fulva]|uniref:Transposable element P transposase-like RNase H C-terminal domain-containing protein n=1 Tax=Ladona fulva TaxID=123851 RepID=A0A8K0NTC7_LADFU|nr:hypothetical protein J437_LFUL003748 [Ladona fulva]
MATVVWIFRWEDLINFDPGCKGMFYEKWTGRNAVIKINAALLLFKLRAKPKSMCVQSRTPSQPTDAADTITWHSTPSASSQRPDMLRWLNQDSLENLFGMIRHNCGSNRNPTAMQFITALKTSLLNGLVARELQHGNCEVDECCIARIFSRMGIFPTAKFCGNGVYPTEDFLRLVGSIVSGTETVLDETAGVRGIKARVFGICNRDINHEWVKDGCSEHCCRVFESIVDIAETDGSGDPLDALKTAIGAGMGAVVQAPTFCFDFSSPQSRVIMEQEIPSTSFVSTDDPESGTELKKEFANAFHFCAELLRNDNYIAGKSLSTGLDPIDDE